MGHRVMTTVLVETDRAPEHRMVNPVVDPVPPTKHRVVTTVLVDTMLQEAKNYPGAPGSQPGNYSYRLLTSFAGSICGGGNFFWIFVTLIARSLPR